MARLSLALACCVLALACATTASAGSSRRFLLQESPAPGTGEVVAGSEAGTNATAANAVAENATNAAPSPSPAMGGAAAGGAGAGNATSAENSTTAAAPAASLNFNTFPEALTSANGTQANLTILVAALEAANLTNALNETTAWTILAPNNAAVERALKELNITAEELLAEKEVVTALLSYHVIPSGALNSTMLPNGTSFPTALTTAGNLTVLRADQNLTITGEGSNATVVAPDIKAGASVIHVIDTVLLPPPQTEVANTTSGAGANMTSPAPEGAAAGAAATSPAPTDAAATSPAPTDAGASPAPAEAGASPAPTEAGASPAPAEADGSPDPAEAGASPAPTEAGASPAPAEAGASPAPAPAASPALADVLPSPAP